MAADIAKIEQDIGRTLDQAAQIFWITGTLSEASIPSLYAAATHYISTSLGEGFDLPMAEAAATGLQLIAPSHTAYLDYLNDEIAYLIPTKREPARFLHDVALNNLFSGAHWWRPDEEALCAILSAVISGSTKPKTGAKDAVSAMTWSNTARQLENLIFEE